MRAYPRRKSDFNWNVGEMFHRTRGANRVRYWDRRQVIRLFEADAAFCESCRSLKYSISALVFVLPIRPEFPCLALPWPLLGICRQDNASFVYPVINSRYLLTHDSTPTHQQQFIRATEDRHLPTSTKAVRIRVSKQEDAPEDRSPW